MHAVTVLVAVRHRRGEAVHVLHVRQRLDLVQCTRAPFVRAVALGATCRRPSAIAAVPRGAARLLIGQRRLLAVKAAGGGEALEAVARAAERRGELAQHPLDVLLDGRLQLRLLVLQP
eukprot:1027660-Prymnesium_polylepis.1